MVDSSTLSLSGRVMSMCPPFIVPSGLGLLWVRVGVRGRVRGRVRGGVRIRLRDGVSVRFKLRDGEWD